MAAIAVCSGPCGRRLCARHAVMENMEYGYIKPSDELLMALFALEDVPRLGYKAAVGPRCPDCRNANARAALAAVPRDWPADPIERRLFQYQNYGLFEKLPAEGWGPSYARAARERELPFDTFSLTERRWLRGPSPVSDGVTVWRFVKTLRVQAGSAVNGLVRLVFELDEEGRSPVYWSRPVKSGLGRHVGVQSGIEWKRGPAGDDIRSLGRLEQEGILVSLAGEPARRLRAPAAAEVSWLGLAPERLYSWLTDPARS